MAKLSARGRKELVRISRQRDRHPGDIVAVWERVTLALMDDRTVLRKVDVLFRGEVKHRSFGWKVKSKVKEGVTPEKFVEVYASQGFTKE